jgi:Carboxypeptidase regulatory-like domain
MKGIKFLSLVVLAQLRSSAREALYPMKAWMVVRSCVAGLVLCVLSSSAMAQDITATISGEVKDPQGAVIAKAKVTLTNTDQNVVVKTITTDSNGNFIFPGLQVGHYAIAVTASGFATFEQKDIDLHASDRYPVHAQLRIGSVSEKVTVEAAPVQVELQTQQVPDSCPVRKCASLR